MAAPVDWDVVVGYADRLSARPGERLTVMASGAAELEAEVVRLPGRSPAAVSIERLAPAAPQAVRTGTHAEVAGAGSLGGGGALTVATWVWLAPATQSGGRRSLLSSWGDGGAEGWALVLDAEGRPSFEVAGGGGGGRAVCERPLPLDRWCRIEGRFDRGAGTVSVARFDGEATEPADFGRANARGSGLAATPGPVLLGAERRKPGGSAESHLDGKLEAPSVAAGDRALSFELGPRRPDALLVNGPRRAVTGRRWSGDVHDWRSAPDQYAAMHFHADGVDDLGWEPIFAVELPGELETGVYAVVLSAAGNEDVVPFVVRARAPRETALLLPSFTYLAYSCERGAPAAAGSTEPEDRWAERNRLNSLYDRHEDGVGVYEASLLRPLTQLRPGYRCAQHGGPHGLAQDLLLLGFLERRGIGFEVLTDHDLHAEGAAALAGRRTAITGAHPEYATLELVEALEAHVAGGGALAYLGGNGLNGRVSVDPERPHVAELRRNETQGLAWQALPGEHHHAATGAYGGDWRRQGHPEHAFLGVGLSAFGDHAAGSYQPVDTDDPAAAIVFEGLVPGEPIGASGAVLGGAAGFEVDNHDPLLGSPADSVVLASAKLGDSYDVWPDDVRDGPAAAPKRRADIVLRRVQGGGTVFSVGSIAWSGCLGDDSNPVARVTENVLRELGQERPFEAGRG